MASKSTMNRKKHVCVFPSSAGHLWIFVYFVNTLSKCANHKCFQHMPFIAFVLSTLKYEWYIVIRTSVSFLVFLMLSGQPMLICLLSRSVNCLSLSYKKAPASMAATYIHNNGCHSPPDAIFLHSMHKYACMSFHHFTWHYFYTLTVIIMNVALKHHTYLCGICTIINT